MTTRTYKPDAAGCAPLVWWLLLVIIGSILIIALTRCATVTPCNCVMYDTVYVVKQHTRGGINYSIYLADPNEAREIRRHLQPEIDMW